MTPKAGLPPEIAAAAPAILQHLQQLEDSPAFKGSKRSQQFLRHIVEKALAGQDAELKERNLGVELFGRSPTYDTGDDAIVRVTASDVRRRLHQYYSSASSPYRIELLAGSYTPEFRIGVDHDAQTGSRSADAAPSGAAKRNGRWRVVVLMVAALAAVSIAAGWFWSRQRALDNPAFGNTLPWSVFFHNGRPVQLVLADPDASAIQELTGSRILLPDYANRRFVPNQESYPPDLQRALTFFRGVNVPAVDVDIALAISRLAGANASLLKAHPSRSLQLSAFRTDDDFILLGSSRSNPWSTLFQEQLDFEFAYDPQLNWEIIRNKRVQSGELSRYVPTARGWDTGHAFAIVALVGNPNQAGNVLLIAGTNAEGTEAAGQFVTNLTQFAQTLRNHGIDPAGAPCRFEILLQVRTMAGSASKLEVVACHRLPDHPTP